MRALKALLGVLALLACGAAFGERDAAAASGDLSFLGCIADGGLNGCVDPPIDNGFDPTRGAEGIAVHGDSVYLTSILNYGAISWFERQVDGSLVIEGCVSRDGPSTGCEGPLALLNGAAGIAVSADGENVYVASTGGAVPEPGSVISFARDPDGSLTFLGCVADEGAYGCEEADLESLDGAFDVVLAGEDAYVASTSGFVTHLSRGVDGELVYEECFADGGTAGCADPGGPAVGALLLPSAIAASPDGANVYVTATNGSSLTAFTRAPGDGSLSFLECHANLGGGGCEDPPKDTMGAALDVVVSPDGANVYVAAYSGDSVSSFTRGAGGSLDFQDCLADDDSGGCVDSPLDAIGHVYALAVDPAGANLYATSTGPGADGGAVLTLSRGTAGKLAFQGCIANDGANGCADMPLDTLEEPHGIAVAEDGQSVYAAAYFGFSISAFAREAVPLAPLLTDTDPDSPADYNQPAIKGSAQAGSTVTLYTSPSCSGPVAAAGSAAQLAGSGLEVTVVDNSTTSFYATASDAEGTSPCSAGITYEEVSAGPGLTPPPQLLATDPASPADDNTPRLLGSAEAGTTINVYANPACAGAPLATASAAQLTAPGIELSVADNTTTTFHASATGSLGTSACSAGLAYVELTPVASPAAAPAPAPAPPPAAGRAVLLGKSVQLGRRLVKLHLGCRGSAGAVCAGKATLRVKVTMGPGGRVVSKVVVSKRFRLAAGRTRVLRIKLSPRGARLARAAGAQGIVLKLARQPVR